MDRNKFPIDPGRPIHHELPLCEVIGQELVNILDGEYLAMFEGHKLRDYMGSGKLDMTFQLIEGDHFGRELVRHFNVELDSDWKTAGGFKVGPRSDYLREMRRLLPEGEMWANPENLQGKTVIVKVDLVKHDRRKVPLDEASQYSVIRQLLKLKK